MEHEIAGVGRSSQTAPSTGQFPPLHFGSGKETVLSLLRQGKAKVHLIGQEVQPKYLVEPSDFPVYDFDPTLEYQQNNNMIGMMRPISHIALEMRGDMLRKILWHEPIKLASALSGGSDSIFSSIVDKAVTGSVNAAGTVVKGAGRTYSDLSPNAKAAIGVAAGTAATVVGYKLGKKLLANSTDEDKSQAEIDANSAQQITLNADGSEASSSSEGDGVYTFPKGNLLVLAQIGHDAGIDFEHKSDIVHFALADDPAKILGSRCSRVSMGKDGSLYLSPSLQLIPLTGSLFSKLGNIGKGIAGAINAVTKIPVLGTALKMIPGVSAASSVADLVTKFGGSSKTSTPAQDASVESAGNVAGSQSFQTGPSDPTVPTHQLISSVGGAALPSSPAFDVSEVTKRADSGIADLSVERALGITSPEYDPLKGGILSYAGKGFKWLKMIPGTAKKETLTTTGQFIATQAPSIADVAGNTAKSTSVKSMFKRAWRFMYSPTVKQAQIEEGIYYRNLNRARVTRRALGATCLAALWLRGIKTEEPRLLDDAKNMVPLAVSIAKRLNFTLDPILEAADPVAAMKDDSIKDDYAEAVSALFLAVSTALTAMPPNKLVAEDKDFLERLDELSDDADGLLTDEEKSKIKEALGSANDEAANEAIARAPEYSTADTVAANSEEVDEDKMGALIGRLKQLAVANPGLSMAALVAGLGISGALAAKLINRTQGKDDSLLSGAKNIALRWMGFKNVPPAIEKGLNKPTSINIS